MKPAGGDMRAATTAPGPQPLRRPVGLSEVGYNALCEQIMSLQIAPGDRITIDALARQFGVSPTPVREALGRLESEGLIHKTHLVGYRAAPQLTRKQFEDLYELRLLIEPFIAARAAERITPEGVEALKALAQEMEGGGAPLPYARFAQLDKRFHDEIARAAHNEVMEEALARLHTHVHLFRLMYNAPVAGGANREHADIIEAFEARGAERAAALMRDHIERSRQSFLATF